jgi:putative endonuclease
MSYFVYILKCADGTYYTGITNDIERRLSEHQSGANLNAYTFSRRPVKLVWGEEVTTYGEALSHERQIKKWSQAKKKALIRGDFDAIHQIVAEERKRREEKKKG